MLTYSSFAAIVLVCLGFEAVALLALWAMHKKGLRPAQTLAFLGAGASFAISLLIVASDGPLYLLAASLGFAFIFHIVDILQRWQK